MKLNRRRAGLLALAMVGTFVLLRLYLHLAPHANFDFGPYNIHHMFTGLLLILLGGVPLVLFDGDDRGLDFAAATFGVGLAMALDEWVYLITTDGSDMSYLLPVSLWGGVFMVGLTLAYILVLTWLSRRRKNRPPE